MPFAFRSRTYPCIPCSYNTRTCIGTVEYHIPVPVNIYIALYVFHIAPLVIYLIYTSVLLERRTSKVDFRVFLTTIYDVNVLVAKTKRPVNLKCHRGFLSPPE
jgi:hypothetical protein